MSLTQTDKITAIQVQDGLSGQEMSVDMQLLHGLFVYGVLLQLTRYGGLETRDWATTADKVILDSNLSPEESLKQYHRVCQSSRTRFLLLVLVHQPPVASPELMIDDGGEDSSLDIRYRLFDSQDGFYIAEDIFRWPPGAMPNDALNVSELNLLFNKTVSHILRAIYPALDQSENGLLPLSTSLEAMKALLHAHWAMDAAEKVRLYELALQDDPALETAYANLGRIYRSVGDYASSVVNYKKALEHTRGLPRNYAVHAAEGGISCALLGKKDIALQWWSQAMDYDPGYLTPYLNVGNLYEDRNELQAAQEAFLKGLRIDSQDSRLISGLARIYSKQGNWEKAMEFYHRQLALDPKDPWCYSDIANCYLHLGNIGEARNYFEKTAELDRDGEAGEYAELILSGLALSS